MQPSPSNPEGGSITRFATPEMMAQHQEQQPLVPRSFAERSAQLRAQQPQSMTYPQQQQQQQQPNMSYAPQQRYYAQPSYGAPLPASPSKPSFQPLQPSIVYSPYRSPQQPPAPQQYGQGSGAPYASPTRPSYSDTTQGQPASSHQQPQAQQPQYQPQIQQQQQPTTMHLQPPPAHSDPSQQQPQVPQQYQVPPQQQTQPQGHVGQSYAARSAQAYATTTPTNDYVSPPPVAPPPPVPPAYGGKPALYSGGPTPPPQQEPSSSSFASPQSYSPYHGAPIPYDPNSPQVVAAQQRMLNEATKKIQEHSYYMKQAMKENNLPVVFDRAAHMVGELGGPPHGHGANNQHLGPTNTGLSAKLHPKNYYELYMRALEEVPTLEDYLHGLVRQTADMVHIVDTAKRRVVRTAPYTMRELYDCVQYCPRVLSRLYLQITVGAALAREREGVGRKWILNSLIQAVRCEQNPIRGLFLRNYLLTALRDQLPDSQVPVVEESVAEDATADGAQVVSVDHKLQTVDEGEEGNVKDSYEFILENFEEMNKLWVRIQRLPGEGKNKDVRRRRERERSELKVLVGTNLVRLSQLENVTSKVYGEVILPRVLEHLVLNGDPLSQAYLMDSIVQVFPDEYHIETLPILLNVCPRLRDKVNVRTILRGLMDRLANYLADEELLDEEDKNEVKKALARDSFALFDECVKKVYNARGPKLTSKEVVRLQTTLLQFSLRCYPGHKEQVSHCLGSCVNALRQANASYDASDGTVVDIPQEKIIIKPLDEASIVELETLLSIPLDSMALKVLELPQYAELIAFLPHESRRHVSIALLEAVDKAGSTPAAVDEIEQLFTVIRPVIVSEGVNSPGSFDHQSHERAAGLMAGLGVQQTESFGAEIVPLSRSPQMEKEDAFVCKLLHLLGHESASVLFEMFGIARKHLADGGAARMEVTMTALVYCCLKFVRQNAMNTAKREEEGDAGAAKATIEAQASSVSTRRVFNFIQETIAMIGKGSPSTGIKLYFDASRMVDILSAEPDHEIMAYDLLTQGYNLYEYVTDVNVQYELLVAMVGVLTALKSITDDEYENAVTKTAQFAAKLPSKSQQCRAVALVAHLFYPTVASSTRRYSNPQRALECLQRALKLADSCTGVDIAFVGLFVDVLESYLYFFEKGNPVVTVAYINGLIALVKEHLSSITDSSPSVDEAKAQFAGTLDYIKARKSGENAELFAEVHM